MKTITITGLSVQADRVTDKSTLEEAREVISAINTVLESINNNVHVFGELTIDSSQVEVEYSDDHELDMYVKALFDSLINLCVNVNVSGEELSLGHALDMILRSRYHTIASWCGLDDAFAPSWIRDIITEVKDLVETFGPNTTLRQTISEFAT